MAINRRLQFVRGSTARNDAFVGREGELTVDTNTWTLRVHDGVTPGGNALGTSNFSGSYSDLTDAPTIPADVGDLTDTGGLLFDGTYASLTGVPVLPTDIADLTDEENLIPTDLSQLTDATGVIPTDVSDLTDTHNIILTLPQIILGMATEEYVDDAIANLVDTAPGTLNTLNELAAAIGDDPNYASTVAGLIGAKANSADLATVATSGRYLDLTNKPFIPTDVNELTDASGLLDHFSGSYADLSDKPVLFSGSYADLTGKPTIPTLGNFTLSDNNIASSSGADPIVLSIFGSDNGDPLPALIDRQWSFNTNGSLTLPGSIDAYGAVSLKAYYGPPGTYQEWSFDGAAGELTFPDDTVQTTAWTGSITESQISDFGSYVASDTTGITGADQVTNMVTLTQAEYDAITPNASTVYFIVG